jgi:hypothetical protein
MCNQAGARQEEVKEKEEEGGKDVTMKAERENYQCTESQEKLALHRD